MSNEPTLDIRAVARSQVRTEFEAAIGDLVLHKAFVDTASQEEVGRFAQQVHDAAPALPVEAIGQRLLEVARESATSSDDSDLTDEEDIDSSGLTFIELGFEEGLVIDQVSEVIAENGFEAGERESDRIYSNNGQLVQIIESAPQTQSPPSIVAVESSQIRTAISQSVFLVSRQAVGGERRVRPPKWLTDGVHGFGANRNHFKQLTGISTTPLLLPDGRILQTPGYDRDSGVYYRPICNFPPIKDEPNNGDARRAFQDVQEPFRDFPFETDADRAATFSLVLTLLARNAIGGSTPLFGMNANMRGTGKSLLADTAAMIALGRSAPRRILARDDGELRKSLTTVFSERHPFCLFDNVEHKVGGGPLDAAITGGSWNDRLLGTNRGTGDIPINTVFACTGNNLVYGTDTTRRVLPIRLLSHLENPEHRTEFRHTNLLRWVHENRGRLVVDLLTVLRAYIVAGRPRIDGGQWGSFQEWSELVRNAIVWAGGADPLLTRATIDLVDDTRRIAELVHASFLELDPEQHGLTSNDIVNRTNSSPGRYQTAETMLEELSPGVRSAHKLGIQLRRFRDRVVNGNALTSAQRGGVSRWSLRALGGLQPNIGQATN